MTYKLFLLCTITCFLLFSFPVLSDVIQDCDETQAYDYIILGVGQAGGVVAGRLAATGKKILAIEAGPVTQRSVGGTDWALPKQSYDANGNVVVEKPYTRFDVPSLLSTYDLPPTPYPPWNIYFNGQLQGGISSWAAKLLGGGGEHAVVWMRGDPALVNSWGSVAQGWSYQDVLPWYKKTENVTGSQFQFDSAYRGESGPIHIVATNVGDVSQPLYLQSCVKNGLVNNTDLNGQSRFGCGYGQTNQNRGIRDSSINAYLAPILQNSNFHLLLNTFISRVIFRNSNNGGDPTAVGVEIYINGTVKKTIKVNSEIIITMGALHTPKLLLLSGIGPAAQLNHFNIPIVYENENVGQNLDCNHVAFPIWNYPGANFPNGWQTSVAVTEYAFYGTGPFAAAGPLDFTYASSVNGSIPNFSLTTLVGSVFVTSGNNQYDKTLEVEISTVNPKMRGSVTLHSSDPMDPANVTLDIWQSQDDINALIAGLRLSRKILTTAPVTSVVGQELSPGFNVSTDAQITQWLKQSTIHSGHWTSTARFGDDPTTSVVDGRLRVRGVTNLRVGDVSVLPFFGMYTQASAAMVGERVSAFIIQDNGLTTTSD